MTNTIDFRGEDLGPYANNLVTINDCIVCGTGENHEWASTRGSPFKAVKCSECGFVWMRNQPNPDALRQYYANYIGRRRLNNDTKMRQRSLQYQDDKLFLQHHVKSGKVLDVGCNGGFFLSCLHSSFEKHGVEIDQSAVDYARSTFDFGKNIICGDILTVNYSDSSFDIIVMRGTIEHVKKPIEVVDRCGKLLKPGGIFYITATPNVDALAAQLFRDRWSLYHPVQHLWHFSPHTLSRLCERYGMTYVSATFPYMGTAYENYKSDLALMVDEIKAQEANKRSEQVSPPFYESMMSIIFRKS